MQPREILKAVSSNDLAALQAALKAGLASGDALRDLAFSMNPLYLAVKMRRPAIAELLLQSGIAPDAIGPDQRSALSLAAENADAPTLQLLIEGGANCALPEPGNFTALHHAVRAGSMAAIRALLAAGADANRRDRASGSTPLYLQIGRTDSPDHTAIIALLLEHSADPELPDGNRNTGLHLSCMRDDPSTAETLLARGATVDALNNAGLAPLHYAVCAGNSALVVALLHQNANPPLRTKKQTRAPSRMRKHGQDLLQEVSLPKGSSIHDIARAAKKLGALKDVLPPEA